MASEVRNRLSISASLWEAGLTALLAQPGGYLTGRLRPLHKDSIGELVVEELSLRVDLPCGTDFPEHANWDVLQLQTPGTMANPVADAAFRSPAAWSRRLLPGAKQTAVLLVLGLPPDFSGWDGQVWRKGTSLPLDGLYVVGGSMLRLERHTPSPRAPEELARWSRTREALGEATWEQVREADVLIAGASRSGSAMAWELAALGVRRLRLVDPDRLEIANLDATFGFEARDVGRAKVEVTSPSRRPLLESRMG